MLRVPRTGPVNASMSSKINKEKYANVILYLCSKLGGEVRGKKKLAKLLYFVDFDLFEKTEKSMTGDIYKALPMGPFPNSLRDITAAMADEGLLKIESIPENENYHPTELYTCLKDPDTSLFSEDEQEILDRVIIKYGHLNGKQLEELTHAEAPYNGTELHNEIPYELAYYRATDFTDV